MSSERAIRIEAGGVRLYAILDSSPTAGAVWEALPLEGPARLWGQEMLIDAALACPLEPKARTDVRLGEIGFWPEGKAIALFFGPTPKSTGPDPVAASPVNVFGRITGDASRLARVTAGQRIRLTPLGD